LAISSWTPIMRRWRVDSTSRQVLHVVARLLEGAR
jgi:hypothetical protein